MLDSETDELKDDDETPGELWLDDETSKLMLDENTEEELDDEDKIVEVIDSGIDELKEDDDRADELCELSVDAGRSIITVPVNAPESKLVEVVV